MTSERRAADLLDQYKTDIYRRTDRLFAGLMGLQWKSSAKDCHSTLRMH